MLEIKVFNTWIYNMQHSFMKGQGKQNWFMKGEGD